jgi:FkbM family methyltransferase
VGGKIKIMKSIERLIALREVNYENVETLWWIIKDKGAFFNPLSDWKEGRDYFLKHVKKFDTVVQAGGNCGMYAKFYSNYFQTVYTFEPEPLNYHCLVKNCQGDKFKISNKGLGETFGKANIINNFPKNVGTHQTIDDINGTIEIITIDSLDLQSCDLIHLDVEEYEPKVLMGSINTIKKFKPVIILEAGRGSEILENLGYTIKYKLAMDWVLTCD